jgi:signal transduction histidine kinase
MLELALRDRRRDADGLVARLHDDVDRLHEALEATHAEENRRLQSLKLAAMAEFAAGAGHEINNPLAVISGQAQFLLRRLELLDGPTEEIDNPAEYLANLRQQLGPSLQKIVGQTQRIHSILTELMQFARPALPRAQAVDVSTLIGEVGREVETLAREREVRLRCQGSDLPVAIEGDPAQLRTSLAALLRNAVEAAPAGGWAGVRVERPGDGTLVFVVEDSGPGPGPLAHEHLFDPFYSGRSAGRGRGMGLPTAWRLARQQDGDVRFDGTHGGVTRFSLVMPLAVDKPHSYTNGQNGAAHNGVSHAAGE